MTERQGPTAEGTTTPPSAEDLMEWWDEGYSQAPDGCIVEPDGYCEHGLPSWLIILGMI